MLTFGDSGKFCPDFVNFWPDGLEIQMGSNGRPIRKQQWENSIRRARCSHPGIRSIWNIGFPTAQLITTAHRPGAPCLCLARMRRFEIMGRRACAGASFGNFWDPALLLARLG